MSGGRLVILPKKSYCPWKPENVERVLRDERLEKERRAAESQECKARTDRLAILRRGQDKDKVSSSSQEHINLFQQEEEVASCRKGMLQGQQQQQAGILPVILGQSELEARGVNRPFYLKAATEEKLLSPKEVQRKDSLDPMKDFVHSKRTINMMGVEHQTNDALSTNSELRARKKHSSKRRRSNARDDDDRKSERRRLKKSPDSLALLRQRRLEREAVESKRAAATMVMDQDGTWNNDRQRSYHNQYNPGLSRR